MSFFRLCCFTCATTEFEIPLGKGYIDHIGVDARFRGKGIGKVLLDMAEIDAKRKGCQVSWIVSGLIHIKLNLQYIID